MSKNVKKRLCKDEVTAQKKKHDKYNAARMKRQKAQKEDMRVLSAHPNFADWLSQAKKYDGSEEQKKDLEEKKKAQEEKEKAENEKKKAEEEKEKGEEEEKKAEEEEDNFAFAAPALRRHSHSRTHTASPPPLARSTYDERNDFPVWGRTHSSNFPLNLRHMYIFGAFCIYSLASMY